MNAYTPQTMGMISETAGFRAGIAALLICCSLHVFGGQEAETSPVFEQFKKFISDPPPIQRIEFSFVGLPISYLDPIAKRVIRKPAPTQYFQAQCNSKNLLIVEMPSLADLKLEPFSGLFDFNRCRIFAQSNEDFWTINGPARSLTYWKGSMVPPYDRGNPLTASYCIRTHELFALMSGGPHFVAPGTIRWESNKFSSVAKVWPGDFLIEGELFPAADGYPEKMSFRIRGTSADGRYLARYYYDGVRTGLPEYLPDRISSAVLHGETEGPDKEIHILAVETGLATAAAWEPALRKWMQQTEFSQLVYTNRNLYTKNQDGTLRPVLSQTANWKPPLAVTNANRYYYVACGLLNIGFLILNPRMRRWYNKTQTKE